MAKREPGLLLFYADVLPILENFDDGAVGAIFRALFRYAVNGEVLELTGEARGVFLMMKHKVDGDKIAYQEKLAKKRYAGYSSAAQRAGETPISFADWKRWRETAEARGLEFEEDE